MQVEINPRGDRSRKVLVEGIVAEVHTRNRNHPHGVMVTLTEGQTGRVKRVLAGEKTTTIQNQDDRVQSSQGERSLQNLICENENHRLEYKAQFLWSAGFTAEDIKNHRPQSKELHEYGKAASKVIIAKSLAGFLNADGGVLVLGVFEDKKSGKNQVVGIGDDLEKLKDPGPDEYRRVLLEMVKTYFPSSIFNLWSAHFRIQFEEFNGKLVCRIHVNASNKRVFLKLGNKEHFFVRIDASTRELLGEEIVEYCERRFL